MVFRILLDDSGKRVFAAGDIVKGRVVLQSQQDEAVGSVLISFMGRAKSKIRRKKRNGPNNGHTSTYRGRGNYFYFSKTLYQGHYTLRANTYEWPFEFQFPSHTDSRAVVDNFDATYPFRSNSDVHPLPPNFTHSNSGYYSSYECYVEYKLEATMTRPPGSSKFFASDMKVGLPLGLLPHRNVEYPSLELKSMQGHFTARTLRLLPEKADAKLSMKEKMRSTFKKSELPSASFSLKIDFPTQIYPGGPFNLKVSMKHTGSNCQQKPTVFLKSVKVEVKSTVSIRAPATFTDHHEHASWSHQLLGRSGINLEIPEMHDVPQKDPIQAIEDGLSLCGTGVVNTRPVQVSFNTYNIAVSSRLAFNISVSCADKIFSCGYQCALMVIPSSFAGPSTALLQAPPDDGAPPYSIAPPVYEHDPEYQGLPEQSSDVDSSQKREAI
jgi:Arrestin (or S-antigen), N-terminal domain